MALVDLRNISKYFDDSGITAVDKFNISIKDEEFIVLVGPSGCGKTTTLRMIAGLEEITVGDLLIDNKRMNEIAPKDRDIAMVFQNYALYPHMSVFDNMAFGLKIRKYPKKEIAARVQEASGILDIEELLDRKPKALSGGQRQRVALGRAIVRKPKVFLFDEPLSNLDAKLRVQMRAEISALHTRLQATMIYVTHDQIEAMTMGDRIVVMRGGLIQQIGTPLMLYNFPINRFVAGFIGSPPMNLIPAEVKEVNGEIIVDEGSFKVKPSGYYAAALKNYIDKRVIFGVRPEDLNYLEDTKGKENVINAAVDVVEPLGSEIHLFVSTENNQMEASVKPHYVMNVGDQIQLEPDIHKVHFFDAETEQCILFERRNNLEVTVGKHADHTVLDAGTFKFSLSERYAEYLESYQGKKLLMNFDPNDLVFLAYWNDSVYSTAQDHLFAIVRGSIKEIEEFGSIRTIHLDLGGNNVLLARGPEKAEIAVNDKAAFFFDTRRIVLFDPESREEVLPEMFDMAPRIKGLRENKKDELEHGLSVYESRITEAEEMGESLEKLLKADVIDQLDYKRAYIEVEYDFNNASDGKDAILKEFKRRSSMHPALKIGIAAAAIIAVFVGLTMGGVFAKKVTLDQVAGVVPLYYQSGDNKGELEGYALTGMIDTTGEAESARIQSESYLLKTDADGNKKHLSVFSGDTKDLIYYMKANGVMRTFDEGYLLYGQVASERSTNTGVFAEKISWDGYQLWRMTLKGKPRDRIMDIVELEDRTQPSYVLAMSRYPGDKTKTDLFLQQYNAKDGDKQWSQRYGLDYADEVAQRIIELKNDGYMVAGYQDNPESKKDYYVIKTNKFGKDLWTYVEGTEEADEIAYDVKIDGSSYVFIGHSSVEGVTLRKLGRSGELEESKSFGQLGMENIKSVKFTSEGNILIYGNITGRVAFKVLDLNGQQLVSADFPGIKLSAEYEVRQSKDGFVLTGTSGSDAAGYKVALVLFDKQGSLMEGYPKEFDNMTVN